MDNLDVAGTFWLAGKPERKVAGRLTFNDADGLELSLIGSLYDSEELLKQLTGPVVGAPQDGMRSESVRILSETTEGYVTLDHCLQKSGSFPLFGVPRPAQEVYRSETAFLGAHFDEDDPLVFTGVRTRIQFLEHWVGLPTVSIDLDYDEKSKGIQQVRVTNTPREKLVTQTSLGELELAFKYKIMGDHIVESTIRQSNDIQLRFLEPQPLKDTIGVCTTLQDLVTIGVDAPVSIDRVTLMHADLEGPIDFWAQPVGIGAKEGIKPPHPDEMPFTFEGIGGLQGIAKWLDVAQKYRLVISRLLSPLYRSPRYVEHRFFDAISAVETLARIRKQDQYINSHDIKKLGQDAGTAFKALVGSVGPWTDSVLRARKYNVVHPGLREGDSRPLYLLSESMYFLVVLSLLKECGVPDNALDRIQGHSRFRNVADGLRSN